MIKCNAECKYERNGECILHPDKVKLVIRKYSDDFRKQYLECDSQILEDRDMGMR